MCLGEAKGMIKTMKIDVLVVTPPSGASLARAVNHNHPPVNQGIDSVPLRLASVIEEQFVTDFLPLNFLDCVPKVF